MLKKLPAPVKGVLGIIFLSIHTLFWCIPLYILLILKFFLRCHFIQTRINQLLIKVANGWIYTNNAWMYLTQNTHWNISMPKDIHPNDWYFITCNHQSWTDILVLQKIFIGKVPFIRFFIKRELLFLPLLGLAWWGYDFPIMARYSKQKIAKNPSLKGKDLMTTKKACQKYQHHPVAILNFLEGTRFTPAKHQLQKSPYKHLLSPKLGGFSYAIYTMDKKIRRLLDVTITYGNGRPTFWDFLCGKVKNINVLVQSIDIPEELLNWDNLEDTSKRELFKNWVEQLWKEKDLIMNELNRR